jgi:NYN domain
VDRCALFVDASYALADSALAVHGTRNRDSVSWDYAGLLKLLGGLSRDRTGLPLLRCYWYDTSTDGNRAREHEMLADIPGVKLRLSKIRPSRKEGVEAEIRKDLTALARNHAISDAIIVSAEEDLGPVIAEVQDLGVRAILLYLTADGDRAVSRTLRQECDDVIEISPSHLRPYVDLIAGAEPRLAEPGFRELSVNAAQVSGPHAAIEAPAQPLYASPLAADYERIGQPQLADLRASGRADVMSSGTGQGELASQPPLEAQRYQRPDGGRGPLAPGADPAFASPAPGQIAAMAGQGGIPAPVVPATVAPGMAGPQAQAGDGLPGSAAAGTGVAIGRHQENGMQLGNGLPQNGLPQNGMPPGGQQMVQQPGGLQPMAPQSVAQQSLAPHSNGAQPQAGQHGSSPHGGSPLGGGQHGGGQHASAQYGSQPGAGSSAHDAGPGSPQGGRHQEAARHFGGNVAPQSQVMQMQPGQPYGAGPQGMAQPGLQAPVQSSHGQQLASQQLPQSLPGQNLPGHVLPAAGQPGQQPQGGNTGPVLHQNGQAPADAQRPPLAPRQHPVGNGVQYTPDRAASYGGQLEPAQFAGPPGNPYLPNPYGAQPAVAPAAAMSVGDAVQSAHAEGFGFGEAVARDAPALWLEAVLARKPRMPSDLEARLLQGSALPIDSLLHDEVRHALRRGFWDALERSRH